MFEIIPKGFYVDFIGRRVFWANVSWIAVAVALVLFFTIGPRWSIDFTGGTEVEFRFEKPTTVDEVRAALSTVGVGDEAIQSVDDPEKHQFLVRTTGESAADPAEVEAVRAALVKGFGDGFFAPDGFAPDAQVGTRITVEYTGPARSSAELQAAVASLSGVSVQLSPEENTFYVRLPGLAETIREVLDAELKDRGVEVLRTDAVGPKVGASLRTAGLVSLLATIGMLVVYIGFRFDFEFAPGVIACLFHDAFMLLGIWIITQQEFGLTMISAVLTLLG